MGYGKQAFWADKLCIKHEAAPKIKPGACQATFGPSSLPPTLLSAPPLPPALHPPALHYSALSFQSCVVLDPYAKAIISRRQYGQLGPNLPYGTPGTLGLMPTWPQAAAAVPHLPYSPGAPSEFDWEGDKPLNRPMEEVVIYEMHVRGFTRDPSSGVQGPGTYRGMVSA